MEQKDILQRIYDIVVDQPRKIPKRDPTPIICLIRESIRY